MERLQMLETVLEGDQLGIKRACERMPRIHSATGPGQALCGRQALMYRPSKMVRCWRLKMVDFKVSVQPSLKCAMAFTLRFIGC